MPVIQPGLAALAGQFAEPLVPAAATSAAEDAALAEAIRRYRQAPSAEDFSALEGFVARFPDSGWGPAVLTNLGLLYYHYGYVSRALAAFDRAWRDGQAATEPHARALADRAAGELLGLHARLAHAGKLVALLNQTEARGLGGRATEIRAGAQQALWALQHHLAVACGVTALKNLLQNRGATGAQLAFLESYRVGAKGVPLAEIGRLAEQAGLAHRLVRRDPGEPVPVPSVMHWKLDHFSAIIGRQGDRFELRDPTFGQPGMSISLAALEAEASGYFLVPDTQQTPFWRDVPVAEAEQIKGRSDPAP